MDNNEEISDEILYKICEKLHEENKDFPLKIYSNEYKREKMRECSIIIKEWEMLKPISTARNLEPTHKTTEEIMSAQKRLRVDGMMLTEEEIAESDY